MLSEHNKQYKTVWVKRKGFNDIETELTKTYR